MQLPTDVSRDGKLLIVETSQSERGVTEVLDLASGKVRPFRESRFDDVRAVLSPDGRWLAFSSNETGRSEVFVAAFSGSGRTWPVSSGGGRFPAWRADGREIVYHALDGRFMAVATQAEGDSFRVGEATELFRTAPPTRDYKDWGMSPDGKLFVIASPGVLEAENELRLIVNWPELMEKR
jgi:Tol biopolymer transport system component